MTRTAAPAQSQARPDAALARSVEAILFTTDRAVPARRLAEALGLVEPEAPQDAEPDVTVVPRGARRADRQPEHAPLRLIADAIDALNREYEQTGRVFRIESLAGGYRVMALPDLAPVLTAFHRSAPASRLSRAAIETLAVIAYRQPVTRAQLEAIRGVACGEVLRSLLERRLIAIKGRAEELGRPMLYGTTREFLDAFGLVSLKDLPAASEVPGGA